MKILIAEDESDLRSILVKRLTAEGEVVDGVGDGLSAIECIKNNKYDIAVLDIMMPGADGYTVLSKIKEISPETPAIFLTARDEIKDRIAGLDLGAVDYITKPFSFSEFKARLRAATRKVSQTNSNVLQVEDLILDDDRHVVIRGDQTLPLSTKEYAILRCLMMNAGKIISREKLEKTIHTQDYEGASNVVDVYISYLRKKIDNDFEEKLIHTVRGSGYMVGKR